MKNKEWLNSLSEEELASWLFDEEYFVVENGKYIFTQPSPKLASLKYQSTDTKSYLAYWLKQERIINENN